MKNKWEFWIWPNYEAISSDNKTPMINFLNLEYMWNSSEAYSWKINTLLLKGMQEDILFITTSWGQSSLQLYHL